MSQTLPTWIWAYFTSHPDMPQNAAQPARTSYQVDTVVAHPGESPRELHTGQALYRVESSQRIVRAASMTPPLFEGVTQHLQYTSHAQRDDLLQRSHPEFPASNETVAVIIPIRKSAAWWAMAHDQRHAHFRPHGDKPGHTAIGSGYAQRIFRRLYHCRYFADTPNYDFITYFEFHRAQSADFRNLLAELRDTSVNPEWQYIETEFEIWMTKCAA